MRRRRSVFISYSSKDRAAAEHIEVKLKEGGLKPWRDKSRLETDWPREVALALTKADAVALLWTDHALESRWVKHEWLTARALEKQIVLCRFPNSPDLPAPIAHLNGVDFKDLEQGSLGLLKHVNNIKTWRAHYDYTIIPPNAYLPLNPNPDFRGRHRELLDLYLDLIGNLKKIGICQVGAVGMGGVGKTQLAVECAYRFSYAFEHIFWIQATDSNRWADQFLEIARAYFNIGVSGDPGGRTVALLKLQKELKQSPNNLIILDNVAEPLLLNSEVPLESSGLTALTMGSNVLFTARKAVSLPGVKLRRVDVLEPESALSLLIGQRALNSPQEESAASDICSAVGYLPLALVLISAFLAKRKDVSFEQYYAELRDSRLEAIDYAGISQAELATRHVAAVGQTFKTQWEALDNQESRLLLQLASLLSESAIIPKARLLLLAGMSFKSGAIRDRSSSAFEAAVDLHLAEELEGGKSIRLHPLLREAIQRTIADTEPFRFRAAEKLRDAYADLVRLQLEYTGRGPRQITADMRIALRWSGQSEAFEDLRQLARALDQETDFLERHEAQGTHAFLQQMHYRTATTGAKGLADLFASSLAGVRAKFLFKAGGLGSQSAAERLHLRGHANAAMGARFLPDDRRALTTAWGDDLSLWDLDTGEVLRRTHGHKAVANCLAVDGAGRIAITGSDDKTLAIWDVESGTVLHRLRGHTDHVQDVCVSSDGRIALSAERGNTLIAWDLNSRTRLVHVPEEAQLGFKGSIALSADGSTALAPRRPDPFKGKWICWDVTTGKPLSDFDLGHPIWGACFGDDTSRVFLTGREVVFAFDLRLNKIVRTYEGPAAALGVVAYRNGLLAAGSSRGEMALWDANSGDLIGAHRGHTLDVKDISFDSTARLILTASEDRSVVLWDVAASGFISLPKHSSLVTLIEFVESGAEVVSGDDEKLISWAARSLSPITEERLETKNITVAGITGDGKRLLAKFPDENYYLCKSPSGARVTGYAPQGRERLIAGAVSCDGSRVLISDNHYQIRLFDSSGKEIRSQRLKKMVHTVAISRDNRFALLGADYGSLMLVELETWTIAAANEENDDSILAVGIDTRSGLAVTARMEGRIEVRHLPSLKLAAQVAMDLRASSVAVMGKDIAIGDHRGGVHFFRFES